MMSLMSRKSKPRLRAVTRVIAPLAVLALLFAACAPDAEEVAEPEPAPDVEEPEEPDPDADPDPDVETTNAFYEPGDLVTLIVPFGVGGGTDVLARIAMPYLAEELGIDIQIINVPGAGSIPGSNAFQNTSNADEGYVMMMHSASSQIPPILGASGVDFSLADQVPIAGFPFGGVIYAKTDGMFESAIDITGPHQPGPFTYGGQAPTGGELRILLLFEMFETEYNAVLGYDGRGPSRLAWEQGESDLSYDTASAYISNVVPLVEEGEAFPLLSFGFVDADGSIIPDPVFADIPGPAEVYAEAFDGADIRDTGLAFGAYRTLAVATIALNKTFIAHGDAPPEAIEDMRNAWDRMLQRDDFNQAAEEELGGYGILLRDDVEAAWATMAAINRESDEIQWLAEWVLEKFDFVILDD